MELIDQFNLACYVVGFIIFLFMIFLFAGWIGWLAIDLKWARREGERNRKRISELARQVEEAGKIIHRHEQWLRNPMNRDLDIAMEEGILSMIKAELESPVVDIDKCRDADGKIQIAFKRDPSPEDDCPHYIPAEVDWRNQIGAWPDCEGDGHYMCAGCAFHVAKEAPVG